MYIKANFNTQTQSKFEPICQGQHQNQTQWFDEIQTNTRNQECAPSKQFVQDDIANSKRTKNSTDNEIQDLGWRDQT